MSEAARTLLCRASAAPRTMFGPAPDSPWRGGDSDRPWTVPVEVPLAELALIGSTAPTPHLRRGVTAAQRLEELRRFRHFDAIEIAVARNGEMHLLDGNHRLYVARERGDAAILVAFFFVPRKWW